MTTDAVQLLRDHWDDVPDADEETVRQAYAYAIRPRSHRRLTSIVTFSDRRRLTSGLKPVMVAVAAALTALVLVPIGGASLGTRAVNGISSLWTTPPNQPALDRAAYDAQSIAGSPYFTAARVDDDANRVDLYLASAPQSIIDQLDAQHPGTYVIHNDAAHPLSELLQLQHAFKLGSLTTAGGSVEVVSSDPTLDGYLKVGIEGHDVQDAQSTLDSIYGAGIIEVYGGAEPGHLVPLGGPTRPPAK